MTIYHVTDGHVDLYGCFSTREKAQEWINRQCERKYPWWEGLHIEEWTVDEAKDLR